MVEWISIKDKKPKIGQHIIGLWHHGKEYTHYESNISSWIYQKKDNGNLTHWMPLPEPPKQEASNA